MGVSDAAARSRLDQVGSLASLGGLSSKKLRSIQWALVISAPALFSMLSLRLGKKTGWDFYNYHWYNPFAFLSDRLGYDIAVGHHATYYNPIADLPLYWIASHTEAWVGGLYLGATVGVAIALLGILAYHTLPIDSRVTRSWASASVALLGALGAGAYQEIGDPANDVPAAIGIFAALILIVRWLTKPAQTLSGEFLSISAKDAYVLIGAGVLAGAAVALKLTIAVYALGIAGALLLMSRTSVTVRRSNVQFIANKLAPPTLFSIGTLIGLILIGGYWMLTMWRYSGNPFFPYFNEVLQSPLLDNASYRDLNFRPKGFLRTLLFPFYFTANSRAVSESVFRDAHILILYVLLPLALSIRWLRRSDNSPPISHAAVFLFAFSAIAYFAWIAVFGIYRYLIPLEMLAPLLIALVIATLPIQATLRVAATIAVLAIAQGLVRVDLSDRQEWSGRYAEVDVPQLRAPEHTLILMTGHAPMSYVIPYFPADIPFLRIDGWLVTASDRHVGLARAMRERVAKHKGPMLVLFDESELQEAVSATAQYGLRLADERGNRCQVVSSNISTPLKLCEVERSSDHRS